MFARRITSSFCCFVLAAVSSVHGQSSLYEATVIVPEVEVRSLNSRNAEAAYATTRLRQGDVVTVVGEKPDGWLAIKPPPGSFSWIRADHVKVEQMPVAIVQHDDAEVRLGSSLVNRLPTVRQVRLKAGERVTLVKDQPPGDDNGTRWLMIHPPANEVRYLPREAVRPNQAATAEPPMNGVAAPVFAPAGGATPAAPAAAGNADPLWQEAERAEREGRLLDAERAYTQLAKQTADHDLRILCHNRVHMIHQANRRNAAAYPPANRLAPTTATRPFTSATSQYTYVPETRPLSVSHSAPPPAAASAPSSAGQRLGPGLLVNSNVPVAGQKGYLLDMGKGQPVCYILPQPGMNLDALVGRHVIVYGPVNYHTGYRQNVMTALQVIPQ